MPKLFLLLLCLAAGLTSDAGRKLKVLFIGNSFTYVNDLPQMIASFAASMGDTLVYDSHTLPGYKFIDHANDPQCRLKIQSDNWDVVVLQEQSQMPSRQTGTFFTNSYHYAHTLDTLIGHHDACASKMFYMTWGYKNGDSVNCVLDPSWPHICTYQGMDSLINLRYRAYADTSLPPAMGYPLVPGSWFSPIRLSQLSPVGAVRRYIRTNHPQIELYQSDGSHPSVAGTYTAACTFYAALFRKDPSLSTYNHTLPQADANLIRLAARHLVYDSLSVWKIGLQDLRADFRYQVLGGNQAIMINNSTGSSSFQWDISDGTTSTSSTFFHTFPAAGIYTVRLIASENGCSDTCYGTVNLLPASISNLEQQQPKFVLAPNPAKTVLSIQANNIRGSYDLRIMDAGGRTILRRTRELGDCNLDINSLSSGLYCISFFQNGKRIYFDSFIKD